MKCKLCDYYDDQKCGCWRSWDLLTNGGLGAGCSLSNSPRGPIDSRDRLPVLTTTSSALEGRKMRRVREPRFPPRFAPNGWLGGIR